MTTQSSRPLSATKDSPPAAQKPDLAAVKAKQQATWSSGDFAMIGVTLQIVGENLCESIDLHAGQRVLDVATGNGMAALAAARRYTEVTAVDYVPALLERGRQRAAADRFAIDFREGDAEALPFADGSFDAVISTFGVMFAPDHERAARELVRVCRKGGKIGLACWTPEGVLGDTFRVIGKYAPPAPGLEPPMSWGSEKHLRKLFGNAVTDWRIARKEFMFRYRSFEHFLDVFRTYYGPMHKTFTSLDIEKQIALTTDLRELLLRYNRSGDASLAYPGEYLEVVVTRA
jgi:ubiquinone/menaquinone biosynthesis C-methylase UbiE